MRIIVCVKQVPDTTGKVAVKADGTMDRAAMDTIINPDDLNAVEAALQIKDKEMAEVIAVSMGPLTAVKMMKQLSAMGVDRTVLVSAREFGGSDTYATSQILAAAIKEIGIDRETVVFCGRQAIDGDTAQVGPQIAEKLNIPQVTYTAAVEKQGNELLCMRLLEDGYMKLKVSTPCLLTCVKELNTPRYMTIQGIMKSDETKLEILDYEALKNNPLIDKETVGLKGSPTKVFRSFNPPLKGKGKRLEGSNEERVAQLLLELRGRGVKL